MAHQIETASCQGEGRAVFQPDYIHAMNTLYTFYEHTHRLYSASPVERGGNTKHEVTKPWYSGTMNVVDMVGEGTSPLHSHGSGGVPPPSPGT